MANLPVWQITNSWREIFARIFEDMETQFNISPEWLVNPATNRHLKLDMLYPQIDVAVRFEGLQGTQHRVRPSLEEEAQQQARDEARLTLCRQHGVELIIVKLWDVKPQATFKAVDMALSRAGDDQKDEMLRKLRTARATASSLSRKITIENDLKLYAELWSDRQYQLSKPAKANPLPPQAVKFAKGMEVEHTLFGSGVVLSVTPSNGDTLITVDFVTSGQKTLAASLVANKLYPRP